MWTVFVAGSSADCTVAPVSVAVVIAHNAEDCTGRAVADIAVGLGTIRMMIAAAAHTLLDTRLAMVAQDHHQFHREGTGRTSAALGTVPVAHTALVARHLVAAVRMVRSHCSNAGLAARTARPDYTTCLQAALLPRSLGVRRSRRTYVGSFNSNNAAPPAG